MPMRASAHGWGIKDREESYYPMVGDNVSLRLTPNLTLTHARMHNLQRLSRWLSLSLDNFWPAPAEPRESAGSQRNGWWRCCTCNQLTQQLAVCTCNVLQYIHVLQFMAALSGLYSSVTFIP